MDAIGDSDPNRAAGVGLWSEDVGSRGPPAVAAGGHSGLNRRDLEERAAHIEDFESSLERQADLIESQRATHILP